MNNVIENYNEDETCSFCVRQEKEFPGRGCMYPGEVQLRVKKVQKYSSVTCAIDETKSGERRHSQWNLEQ